MSFLRFNNHTPILTVEGLLVLGETVVDDRITMYQDDQDDNWFQEPMVFPITANNTVDLAPIKAWLGY